jgi:transcriptional regulator with XRE-family HTH domain
MDGRALLAHNLVRLRLARGVSQERLAADSGVDRAWLSQVERGRGNASLDVIDRLAGVLEVSVSELFAQADGRTTPEPLKRGPKPRKGA